jgi:hypothetical protein
MKRIFLNKKDGNFYSSDNYNRSQAIFTQLEVVLNEGDEKTKCFVPTEIHVSKSDIPSNDRIELLPSIIVLNNGDELTLMVNSEEEFKYIDEHGDDNYKYDKTLFRQVAEVKHFISGVMLNVRANKNDFEMYCIFSSYIAKPKYKEVKDDIGGGTTFPHFIAFIAQDGVLVDGEAFHSVNLLTLAEDKGMYFKGKEMSPSLIYFKHEKNATKYVRLHETRFSLVQLVAILKTYTSPIGNPVDLLANDEELNNMVNNSILCKKAILDSLQFKQLYNA